MILLAGGDLRLHDQNGLTAYDWVKKCADEKKRKKMLEYLEKVKLLAASFSGPNLQLKMKSAGFLHKYVLSVNLVSISFHFSTWYLFTFCTQLIMNVIFTLKFAIIY